MVGGNGDFGSALGSFILKTATAIHTLREKNKKDFGNIGVILLDIPEIRLLCSDVIFQQAQLFWCIWRFDLGKRLSLKLKYYTPLL